MALGRMKVYLEYYFKSKTIYNIHSPYLFELICFCFDKNRNYYDFRMIDQLYRRILADQSTITCSEFAASHGQQLLTISQMAHKASASLSHAALIYRIGLYFKPKCILELGTCVGISAMSLGLSVKQSKIYSVDGNVFLSSYATKNCTDAGLNNIVFRCDLFADFLNTNDLSQFDFVYLDGDHQYGPTLAYVRKLLTETDEEGIIILDDIHWSNGMYQAWKEIISWPECNCSLETQRLGFVFKSAKLSPGHFSYIPVKFKPWRLGLFS